MTRRATSGRPYLTAVDCASRVLASQEVLMDVSHPDIWVHSAM